MIEALIAVGDSQLLGTFLIGFLLLFGAKVITAIYSAEPSRR